MRWLPFVSALGLSASLMVTLAGCDGVDPNTGLNCQKAAGLCVLGTTTCLRQAATDAQDCNLDGVEEGAFCCLEQDPNQER